MKINMELNHTYPLKESSKIPHLYQAENMFLVFEIFEKFLSLKYLINTRSADVNYILSLFVSYVRMPCPDMSKYVQIEF